MENSVVTAFWELALYPISTEHIYYPNTRFWVVSLSGTNTLAYLILFKVTERKICATLTPDSAANCQDGAGSICVKTQHQHLAPIT
jgi:hypothetical protein